MQLACSVNRCQLYRGSRCILAYVQQSIPPDSIIEASLLLATPLKIDADASHATARLRSAIRSNYVKNAALMPIHALVLAIHL